MQLPLRFGVLGTARITPHALLRPARRSVEATVAAVASRRSEAAGAYARRHGIPRVHSSYEALLADPEIDAVYLPLPNSLHLPWGLKALQAGKHLLCEKPLANNADEAQQLADAAAGANRVLAEAMHYRYHPLAARIQHICRHQLGRIQRVEMFNCFPIVSAKDIRYDYSLGGGGMMDLGCYAVSLLRLIAGEEPTVVRAAAKLAGPKIDRRMEVDLQLPSGGTAHLVCSIWSWPALKSEATVTGEAGELRIGNPFAPHLFHFLKLKTASGATKEQLKGLDTTYDYQLRSFVAAVNGGPRVLTDGDEAAATLRIIDAAYQAAGLPRRGETR